MRTQSEAGIDVSPYMGSWQEENKENQRKEMPNIFQNIIGNILSGESFIKLLEWKEIDNLLGQKQVIQGEVRSSIGTAFTDIFERKTFYKKLLEDTFSDNYLRENKINWEITKYGIQFYKVED